MKIVVMGYSGSGKSTLSIALATRFHCPVLHLDRVNFAANWKERNREEAERLVSDMLERPAWVIEGNYAGLLLERRLAECDRILLLLLPRRVCFVRAYRRYLRFHGQSRPDMAEGCAEKFDWVFAKWILRDGRDKAHRAQYDDICRRYPSKTVVLRSSMQIKRWAKEQNALLKE